MLYCIKHSPPAKIYTMRTSFLGEFDRSRQVPGFKEAMHHTTETLGLSNGGTGSGTIAAHTQQRKATRIL